MLIQEAIQSVQSLYSKGVHTDDTRMSSRQIYSKLSTVRSMLLAQKLRKKQRLNDQSYQTLNCIKLIKAAKHECPCIPNLDCNVYKTEMTIPDFLIGFKPMIESVTSIDGEISFNRTTWQRVKDVAYHKYTGNSPVYWLKDNFVFVMNNKKMQFLAIRGVFEDVLAAHRFNSSCYSAQPCCDDCDDIDPCVSNLSYEFDMDSDLIDTAIKLTYSELLPIFLSIQQDNRNNSKDDKVE